MGSKDAGVLNWIVSVSSDGIVASISLESVPNSGIVRSSWSASCENCCCASNSIAPPSLDLIPIMSTTNIDISFGLDPVASVA